MNKDTRKIIEIHTAEHRQRARKEGLDKALKELLVRIHSTEEAICIRNPVERGKPPSCSAEVSDVRLMFDNDDASHAPLIGVGADFTKAKEDLFAKILNPRLSCGRSSVKLIFLAVGEPGNPHTRVMVLQI